MVVVLDELAIFPRGKSFEGDHCFGSETSQKAVVVVISNCIHWINKEHIKTNRHKSTNPRKTKQRINVDLFLPSQQRQCTYVLRVGG